MKQRLAILAIASLPLVLGACSPRGIGQPIGPVRTGPTPPTLTVVTTPVGMCPQEDSCTIDYRSDGRWYITKAAH